MLDIVEQLGGPSARPAPTAPFLIIEAGDDPRAASAYGAMRRHAFVEAQGLFARHDRDQADQDPRTRVLVAITPDRDVIGGVRLHPEDGDVEIGWWRGSRLVAAGGSGVSRGQVGAALVRAACATAMQAGVLRFDAHVQDHLVAFFVALGWEPVRALAVRGAPHTLMRWRVDRFEALATATKGSLGPLVGSLLAQDGWRGDDGTPVPRSEVVACLDAITPSMVERDPEWAGWCGMLVTAHDLAAMGAEPLGALDALAALDAAHAGRVLSGLRRGSEALGLPVLGGHTQLGVPAALSLTGFGHAADPVPAGGGQPGDPLTLTADLEGGWRPGYRGRQWDSTSWRTRDELTPMLGAVRQARPRAAKDVSMAGIVGTAGMLAEASGCGAVLDVAAVPRPSGALLADWLTCFPGFAMLTADRAERTEPLAAGPARSARCGELTIGQGVRLRWPDGDLTEALPTSAVTGLGPAARPEVLG